MSKYKQVYDEETIEIPKTFRMECCDCSLVHIFTIVEVEGRFFLKSKQDPKATKRKRKEKKIQFKPTF